MLKDADLTCKQSASYKTQISGRRKLKPSVAIYFRYCRDTFSLVSTYLLIINRHFVIIKGDS